LNDHSGAGRFAPKSYPQVLFERKSSVNRLRIVLPLLLAAICFAAFTGVAMAVQSPTSDQPAPSGPTASPLLIVELDAPPLAAMYKTQLSAASAGG
jgi:hypothetical protein